MWSRVGIKCNHLNYLNYKYLEGYNEPWYCLSFTAILFPFGNLNNQKILDFLKNNNNNNNDNNINNNKILKPPPDLLLNLILFIHFSNGVPDDNNDPENVMQSKYYDIDELQQMKFSQLRKFSVFLSY